MASACADIPHAHACADIPCACADILCACARADTPCARTDYSCACARADPRLLERCPRTGSSRTASIYTTSIPSASPRACSDAGFRSTRAGN